MVWYILLNHRRAMQLLIIVNRLYKALPKKTFSSSRCVHTCRLGLAQKSYISYQQESTGSAVAVYTTHCIG